MCLQAVDIFPGCPVEKLSHGDRFLRVLFSFNKKRGMFRHVSFLQFFESGVQNSLVRGDVYKAMTMKIRLKTATIRILTFCQAQGPLSRPG